MSYPTIEIMQRPGTEHEPMTGANTIVKVNGKEMGGLTRISIELDAQGLAIVKMESVAHVHFLGTIGKLNQQAYKLTPMKDED